MTWANEPSISIWRISISRNLESGGPALRVRGSVVVNSGKRVKRVLALNPDGYTCLLEPGVPLYTLNEEVQKRGYKHMWVDKADVGGGSVIGNTLYRGVGYTPYRGHWATHSGLEAGLPTGEVMRTGMGALPSNNTRQVILYGFGPVIGMLRQSNSGIVTQVGTTLMPNPGGHESFVS